MNHATRKSEEAFIGCLLRSPHEVWHVMKLVRPEMIAAEECRTVYRVIIDLSERGRMVTDVTVVAAIEAEHGEEYGDGSPWAALVPVLRANAQDAGSSIDYADAIRDQFTRYRIRRLGDAALKAGADAKKTSEEILSEIETHLLGMVQDNEASNIKWLHEAAQDSLARTAENHRVKGEVQIGITTGIAEMDDLLGPLMGGDLVTLAAPSGHGKTTLAVQILCHASRRGHGRPAFLISMEMMARQIARRVMASWTEISARKQRSGDIDEYEYRNLSAAAQRAGDHQVLIDESGRQSTARICKKIRAMHRMHGLGCAAIDHILLVKPDNPRWSKIETIEHSAMAFKELAKELEIPIFLLAQLTRGSQSDAKTWKFTDQALYGGDAIKQASDAMLGVTLPKKWLKQREPDPSDQKSHDEWVLKMDRWADKAEVGALKMRDDDDGHWFSLPFDGATFRFGSRQ